MYYCYMLDGPSLVDGGTQDSPPDLNAMYSAPILYEDNFLEGSLTRTTTTTWRGETRFELSDGTWCTIFASEPCTTLQLPPDVYAGKYTGLRRTYMTLEDGTTSDDVDVFLAKGQILNCVGVLTVLVDDILAAGRFRIVDVLHTAAEKAFGKVKRQHGEYRHYDIDVVQLLDIHYDLCTLTWSQHSYLESLNPVAIKTVRGDGRTQETALTSSEITDFRSVSCGMSWMGRTSPMAMAMSSLYQSMLPTPSIKQGRMLNNALEQLRA